MKLTKAQLAALRSARDHDDICHHLTTSRQSLECIQKSRRTNGGFMRTRISLLHRGLIDWRNQITEAGLAVIKEW